jgi:hypothetical protein
MKKIFHTLILFAMLIAFNPACDIIEEPYLVPVGGNDTVPVEENVRKVLLEDFTGQKCPNCPEAAEIALTLKGIYGEQLVIIAIHAGFYAIPDNVNFTADFRTPEGNELNSSYNIAQYGYPSGMVNRTEYNGFPVVAREDWETAVGIEIIKPLQAGIKITNTFNSGTRQLDCQVESEFVESLTGTYNLCVVIIESGIVSPQETAQDIDEDYIHNHMLRASMNGTWGEPVGTDGTATAGVTLTNTYHLTFPAAWNAENCAVVAYIYNAETLEIIQAEEKEL